MRNVKLDIFISEETFTMVEDEVAKRNKDKDNDTWSINNLLVVWAIQGINDRIKMMKDCGTMQRDMNRIFYSSDHL